MAYSFPAGSPIYNMPQNRQWNVFGGNYKPSILVPSVSFLISVQIYHTLTRPSGLT